MADSQTAVATRPDAALMQQNQSEDEQQFKLAQRQAVALSQSSLVPQQFKNNVPNCLIAMNMAKRLSADPLMVMQNLYIVHEKPGWSSKFLIAACNQTGRFSAIKYKFDGEGDQYGCTAYVTEFATKEKIEGPKVTLAMVRAEGWLTKNGSKWKTMPELMFRYRAASFFVNTTCPEIAMGLQTREELEDVIDIQSASPSASLVALREQIEERHQIGTAKPIDEPTAAAASSDVINATPVRAATLSEIRKMEAVLTTVVWTAMLPDGGMDEVKTEEHGRSILQAMKDLDQQNREERGQ